MTSSGDELRAALHARKDLGPDFEEALIESFLEKVDREIDRRVDSRLARERPLPQAQPSPDSGRRLALAIVSVVLGVVGSIAALAAETGAAVLVIWIGIAVVNVAFMFGDPNRAPVSRSRQAPPAPEDPLRW
ncbi:hypothetical protein [Nonomuraea guangzhouensis]|uniref:DUF3040 domain-containing protein n=1 Tax=Nonomuraea guangzhouensis TaxID=1291555 RepID=A0ABW4G0P1_9ACTN|nr:hypothetical protein [Nonomuraea guangzhouensis]